MKEETQTGTAETANKRPETVFLGMPSYSGPSMQSARSYYRASKKFRTLTSYNQASLLNTNCAVLWARMLNLIHRGERIDFFAMLHDDIFIQDHWLDELIPEMERHNLDVLSVVSPIKDTRGLTSTAIDSAYGSHGSHRVKCRLSMSELYELPETFTGSDCGYPGRLLVNTGCFVARINGNENWADQIQWDSSTRIYFDHEKDLYVVDGIPEDWYVSRQFNKLGLRVGATRKLQLYHRGKSDFANTHPWGDLKFDSEFLQAPAIASHKPPDGFRFPFEVEGWLTEGEGRKLAEIAKGKHVLEIGSYCGRSTICLAHGSKSVVAVDTFDGRDTPNVKPTFEKFGENLARHNVNNVKVVRELSKDALAKLRIDGWKFDLVFIDGSHAYESVLEDIKGSLHVLNRGGLLAFHDYGRTIDPGVKQAVDELLLFNGAELISVTDYLAVVRPKV